MNLLYLTDLYNLSGLLLSLFNCGRFPRLHLYWVFRIWTSCIRLVFTRLACVWGTGRFVDDILHILDLTLAAPDTVTDCVPGLLQLLQSRADADRALLADFGKAPRWLVPDLRQRCIMESNPLAFSSSPALCRWWLDYCVVAGFLNAKYRHHINHPCGRSVRTNRTESVQTNGRLSCRISLRRMHTTTHGRRSNLSYDSAPVF